MLALSLLSAVLAAAPGPFNLTCAGTVETTSFSGKTSASYTSIYRIDLDTGRWCESECKVRHPLVDVQPVVLVLEKKDIDTPREREILHNEINRETGAHSVLAISGLGSTAVSMKWTGACEKGPFTGFPDVATKF